MDRNREAGGASDRGAAIILVRDGKAGLPYSKGLLASSVLAIGLTPDTAYGIAERIEGRLRDDGIAEITARDLRDLTSEVLRDELGTAAADRYEHWQALQERDHPLIVLIGGATGVGKSTVATQLAYRLGIVRIVSTDVIREVMRGMVSPELLPTLHLSSYQVAEAWAQLVPPHTDLLMSGFNRQVAVVAVGIRNVLQRAVIEQTDLIVEGVHLVPGAVQIPSKQQAIVVPIVLTIEDVDVHRSHFLSRSQDIDGRPPQRYLDYFDEIRRIQDETVRRARDQGVPEVRSYDLDTTVSEVMHLVVEAVTERAGKLK